MQDAVSSHLLLTDDLVIIRALEGERCTNNTGSWCLFWILLMLNQNQRIYPKKIESPFVSTCNVFRPRDISGLPGTMYFILNSDQLKPAVHFWFGGLERCLSHMSGKRDDTVSCEILPFTNCSSFCPHSCPHSITRSCEFKNYST